MRFLVAFVFCFGVTLKLFCQGKYIQVYQTTINTQKPNQITEFKFYYIIDSSKQNYINNKLFYGFTFSTDSCECSGYIRYDNIFQSLDYLDSIQSNDSKLIFAIKGTGITYDLAFPFLGAGFTLIRKNNRLKKATFTVKYTIPIIEHSIRIKEIEFTLGKMHPTAITFYFPFNNKTLQKVYPLSYP